MLKRGLYEQVINKSLDRELECSDDIVTSTGKLDGAEAPQILSHYISELVEKGLRQVSSDDISGQLSLANRIVSAIADVTGDSDFDGMSVAERAEQLLAVAEKKNTLTAVTGEFSLVRPETSLAASSLFTGSIHEPSMMSELKKEIQSADRVDMLVSFVKWSGLRLIIDELSEFTQRGGKLRVITTSYMGATDVKAVEELRKLPNTEIRISYDTKRTRLHAKAYVFWRETGFSTAYVGSSNLSNAAISSGLEWNLKITAHDQPSTLDKISPTYESYWNSHEFPPYSENDVQKLSQALSAEKYSGETADYLFDINPYPYQQEILDRLKAERDIRGHFRNLVVAATGTGKTVISAFDYRSFRSENAGKPCRLLFVAHRKEILEQSIKCFRGVLHDPNFGELFVGEHRPDSLDNLLVSVQTLNSRALTEAVSEDFYDFIIVDEFHHTMYQNPDLTPDERNAVWLELEHKYRPWIDFDALPFYGRGAGWQRQLHIYECPFYYIDYCLSTMAALQFFLLSLKDHKDAWQRYLKLVRRAGLASYTELCETAGLKVPFTGGSIKAIAQEMGQWIAAHQV